MSDAAPATEANTSSNDAQSGRNPTEKLVVRTLIILLLVFMLVEAHGRLGYSSTLSGLQAKLALDDQGQPLNVENVDGSIMGFPSRSESDGSITLRWFSLIKSYGIKIAYDDENNVTTLLTDLPPEDASLKPQLVPSERGGDNDMEPADHDIPSGTTAPATEDTPPEKGADSPAPSEDDAAVEESSAEAA